MKPSRSSVRFRVVPRSTDKPSLTRTTPLDGPDQSVSTPSHLDYPRPPFLSPSDEPIRANTHPTIQSTAGPRRLRRTSPLPLLPNPTNHSPPRTDPDNPFQGAMAQQESASDSESEGRGFESRWSHVLPTTQPSSVQPIPTNLSVSARTIPTNPSVVRPALSSPHTTILSYPAMPGSVLTITSPYRRTLSVLFCPCHFDVPALGPPDPTIHPRPSRGSPLRLPAPPRPMTTQCDAPFHAGPHRSAPTDQLPPAQDTSTPTTQGIPCHPGSHDFPPRPGPSQISSTNRPRPGLLPPLDYPAPSRPAVAIPHRHPYLDQTEPNLHDYPPQDTPIRAAPPDMPNLP